MAPLILEKELETEARRFSTSARKLAIHLIHVSDVTKDKTEYKQYWTVLLAVRLNVVSLMVHESPHFLQRLGLLLDYFRSFSCLIPSLF